MAITRDKKKLLLEQYAADLKAAKNIIIIQQNGLDVATTTQMRRDLVATSSKYNVVRKRLFVRAIKDAGLPEVDIDQLEGSVAVLFIDVEWLEWLSVVNKVAKKLNKNKDLSGSIKFLWAWLEWERKDGEYVTEVANVPSKEELLSKLVYLFNYPVQSFAGVLDQISKKIWEEQK